MAGGIGDILQNNIQRRFQPRQKLADALMQGAYDTSPVTSPWEALGRIAQGGIAGYAGRRVRDKETEAQKAATDTLSRALMGDNVDYNILGGNQDTAGLGLDLKVNDITQRREMENQRALAAARASERNKFFDVEGGQRDSDGRFYPSDKPNDQMTPWGNSQQSLALKAMVDRGEITKEQADLWLASTNITDPSTGAIIRVDPTSLNKGQNTTGMPPVAQTGAEMGGPSQGVTQLTGGKQSDAVNKQAQQLLSLQNSLKGYKDTMAKTGPSPFGEAIGDPGAVELGSRRQDLLLGMKELFNLGVLNGNDYQIISSMISDPNSFKNILIGANGYEGQLKVIEDKLANAQNNLIKTNPNIASIFQQQAQPQPTPQKNTRMRYDAATDSFIPVN